MAEKLKPPHINDIPRDFDPRLREILEQLREYIDFREGQIAKGTKSRFVTIQDLIDAGVIAEGDIV